MLLPISETGEDPQASENAGMCVPATHCEMFMHVPPMSCKCTVSIDTGQTPIGRRRTALRAKPLCPLSLESC